MEANLTVEFDVPRHPERAVAIPVSPIRAGACRDMQRRHFPHWRPFLNGMECNGNGLNKLDVALQRQLQSQLGSGYFAQAHWLALKEADSNHGS